MLNSLRAALAMSVITFTAVAPSLALAEPLKVVASFSIIGDFAKNVGGDRVEITTLVGPDGDAHIYEPKPADAVTMAKADVVLVNGLHFEGFLKRLVDASATKANVVELTKGIDPIKFNTESHDEAHGHSTEAHEDHTHDHHHDGHDHGPVDPHAFQSVRNAMIYVRNVADAFCAADSAGCDIYKANADTYTEKLGALDTEIRLTVDSIPEAKRVVITSHDAFGYFAREYGVNFLAPQGISTDSEASAADVAKLVEQVRQHKAAAIFMENISNPRLIEQIANETGVKVGGTLYSDALSAEDGPAATYIGMMQNNIGQIKGAIAGS